MAGTLHPPRPETTQEYLIEIYQAIQHIAVQLTVLDSKLSELGGRLNESERRLRALETWRAVVTGRLIVASAASGVVGVVAGWVGRTVFGGGP